MLLRRDAHRRRAGARERALQGARALVRGRARRHARCSCSTRSSRRCSRTPMLPDELPRRDRPRRAGVRRRGRGDRRRRARRASRRRCGRTTPRIILYTSGTTANPKGCVYNHDGMAAQAFDYARRAGADARRPLLDAAAALPRQRPRHGPRHPAAPCALVHVGRRFDPGPALEQLEARAVHRSPSRRSRRSGSRSRTSRASTSTDLRSLRLVIAVGSPGALRLMQERLPVRDPDLRRSGARSAAASSRSAARRTRSSARLTTNGRAVRRLGAPDRRPGDRRGRCRRTRPARSSCAARRASCATTRSPSRPRLAIDAEGWFHSGDLGRLDEEGRLSFVGRLKDMLKVGGENVAAAEIETFLLTHPAVRDRAGRERARRALHRGRRGVRAAASRRTRRPRRS